MLLKNLFLLVFLSVLAQPLLAQQQKKVPVRFIVSGSDKIILNKYPKPAAQPDSLAAIQEIRKLVQSLQRDAYLTASADSIFTQNDTLKAVLYIGPQFEWAQLKSGNLNEGMLIKAGFREKFFNNKPFRPDEFVELQQKLLEHAEDNGYPFAQTWLDSVAFQGTQVNAVLMLDVGPLVTYDTLLIEGSTRTTTRFLSRYLQISPGQPYSHQRVEAANRMIKQLPYIRMTRSPQVRFARDKARVIYYLEDNKANQIDGIIGFLPNSDDGLAERKLLVTGEANINIRNIKGGGKQIGLQWRKVDRNSQTLEAGYLHPNLFGSPLEAGANFSLFKQDTTFITIKPRIEFSYYTQRYGKISFFTEYRSSRLLSTKGLENSNTLPPYADVRYNSYGINYLWHNLDDFYYPRSGLLGNFQFAIGNKVISRNINLEASLYDSINLRSAQLNLSGRIEYYFKLGKNGVLLTRLKGESLFNDQLFLNDMYRVGGLNTLRGFDDFFFFASTYAVATAEYRIFTSDDSYALLFFDQGFYDNQLENMHEFPFGVGGGISLSTGAGIFQFIYSVGNAEAQPFSFNTSKVHFGITNRF